MSAPIWKLSDYLRFLRHNNPLVKKWALNNLTKHYPREAVEEVASLLEGEDTDIIVMAVQYLGESNDLTAGPKLLTKLKQSEQELAKDYITALGKLGYREALPYLQRRLVSTKDYREFTAICSCFAKLGGEDVCKALRSILSRKKLQPLDWAAAANALLECGIREDVVLIIRQYLAMQSLEENEINYCLDSLEFATGTSRWSKILDSGINTEGLEQAIKDAADYAGLNNCSLLADANFLHTIEKQVNSADLAAAAGTIASQAVKILKQKGVEIENWQKQAANLAKAPASFRIYLLRWLIIREFANQDKLKRTSIKEEQLQEEVCFLLSCLLGLEMYARRDLEFDSLSEKEQNDYLLKRVTSNREEVPPVLEEAVIDLGEPAVPKLAETVKTKQDSWAAVRAARILTRIAQRYPGSIDTAIPALLETLKKENGNYLLDTVSNALVATGPKIVPHLRRLFTHKDTDLISILSILQRLPYQEAVELLWEYREDLIIAYPEMFIDTIFKLGSDRFIEFLEAEWHEGEEQMTETLLLLCELHERRINKLEKLRQEYRKTVEVTKKRYASPKDDLWQPDTDPLSLKLRCCNCGRTFAYQIEEVHVDVSAAQEGNKRKATDSIIIPQDIVCKKCGTINNYELTAEAYIYIMSKVLLLASAPDPKEFVANSRVKFGVSKLADGTVATPQEAIEHYSKLVDAEPKRVDLRIRYGNVLRRTGRVEEALEQYETACRLDPKSIEGHYNLLTLYDNMGQKQKAVAAGKRLLELAINSGKLTDEEIEFAESGLDIMMHLAPALAQSLVPAGGNIGAKTTTSTIRRIGPKIGRNDPCPCGSGKKYKKCCGR